MRTRAKYRHLIAAILASVAIVQPVLLVASPAFAAPPVPTPTPTPAPGPETLAKIDHNISDPLVPKPPEAESFNISCKNQADTHDDVGYPVSARYDKLLAASQVAGFDITKFDISYPNVKVDTATAAGCLQAALDKNTTEYNRLFAGLLTIIKSFNTPAYLNNNDPDTGQPKNKFWEINADKKLVLTTRSIANSAVIIGLAQIPILMGFNPFPEIFARATISGFEMFNEFDSMRTQILKVFWLQTELVALLSTQGSPTAKMFGSTPATIISYITTPENLNFNDTFSTGNAPTLKSMLFFAKSVDAIIHNTIVAGIDKAANSTFSRCGNGPGGLLAGFDVGYQIMYAVCSFAVLGQDWASQMLTLAFGLFSSTANLGGDNNNASWLPEGLRGNMQGLFAPTTGASPSSSLATTLRNAIKSVQGLVNFILILLFFVIALASILQIQVNNYSINKLLPALVIGFILSLSSVFIVRVGLEVAGIASTGMVSFGSNPTSASVSSQYATAFSAFGGATTSLTTTGKSTDRPDIYKVFLQYILNGFTIAAATMIFILAFLFVIRSIVFFFLTPLAPIAFFGAVVPPLKSIWTRWSKTFTSWLFMPVVASFWLWLGLQWIDAVKPPTTPLDPASNLAASPDFFTAILSYSVAMFCIFLAMKTPFSMAGEAKSLVDKWNTGGKKAWSASGGFVGNAAKREAGIFARNKNLLWNQSIKSGIDGYKAVIDKRVQNSKDSYGARDTKVNNAVRTLTNRLDTRAEEMKVDKAQLTAMYDLNDRENAARKALIEAVKHGTHSLDDSFKDLVRSMQMGDGVKNKGIGKKLHDQHELAMKYQAESVLQKTEAEQAETKANDHWMHYLDHGEIDAFDPQTGKSVKRKIKQANGMSSVLEAEINAEREVAARGKLLEKRKFRTMGKMNESFADEAIVDEYMNKTPAELAALSQQERGRLQGALDRLTVYHQNSNSPESLKFEKHYATLGTDLRTSGPSGLISSQGAHQTFSRNDANSDRRKEYKKGVSKEESIRIETKAREQIVEDEFVEKFTGSKSGKGATVSKLNDSLAMFTGTGSKLDTFKEEDRIHAQKAMALTLATADFEPSHFNAIADHLEEVEAHANTTAVRDTYEGQEFRKRMDNANKRVRDKVAKSFAGLTPQARVEFEKRNGLRISDLQTMGYKELLRAGADLSEDKRGGKSFIRGILAESGANSEFVAGGRDSAKPGIDLRKQEAKKEFTPTP